MSAFKAVKLGFFAGFGLFAAWTVLSGVAILVEYHDDIAELIPNPVAQWQNKQQQDKDFSELMQVLDKHNHSNQNHE